MNNQPSISDAPKKYGNTQLLHPMLLSAWDLRVSIQLPALFLFIVLIPFLNTVTGKPSVAIKRLFHNAVLD